jgi:hypothetical protein
MRDIMLAESSTGLYPIAWVFFIVYLVVTSFIFLNVLTAIVLDQ